MDQTMLEKSVNNMMVNLKLNSEEDRDYIKTMLIGAYQLGRESIKDDLKNLLSL